MSEIDERRRARGERRIRRGIGERLSYANVIATIALIVAVGTGGAWAASQIGSKDIKKNAVKSKHITSRTVR